MFRLIFFAVIALASANLLKSGCPDVKTVDNFDFKAYGQGRWYELAKYVNIKEKNAKCGYAEYTPEGDGFKIYNVDYVDGKLRDINGFGKLAPDAGTNGRMIFTYPYGPNGSMADNPVNVLYTDNKNIAIIYYCKFIEKTQAKFEYSWVLSRSKSLSSDLKASLDTFVKSSEYIDETKYKWNDFSDESCKDV